VTPAATLESKGPGVDAVAGPTVGVIEGTDGGLDAVDASFLGSFQGCRLQFR
jgi:hypothetical protein